MHPAFVTQPCRVPFKLVASFLDSSAKLYQCRQRNDDRLVCKLVVTSCLRCVVLTAFCAYPSGRTCAAGCMTPDCAMQVL